MTAVEFLESQYKFNGQLFKSDFQQAKAMEKEQKIEFAKLHVEAALKSASELEETDGTEGYKIYPDSILTAYPLENIM